jgi:hypothetical protein
MLRVWWGIAWRFFLVWLVIAIPVSLLYALIVPTAFSIIIKPTIGYLLIALLIALIGMYERLNYFIWKNIVDIKYAKTISSYLAIVAITASILNLLVGFNLSVDDYVDAKKSVGVFAFIICPFIIAFIVKFRESELTNIN